MNDLSSSYEMSTDNNTIVSLYANSMLPVIPKSKGLVCKQSYNMQCKQAALGL